MNVDLIVKQIEYEQKIADMIYKIALDHVEGRTLYTGVIQEAACKLLMEALNAKVEDV